MKLSNHDLALHGMLSVLPPYLERYLRNTLGNRCTPEMLRALLAGSGPVPELPDLADLSIQIRILTARGSNGRYLMPLPPGAGSKLHEVRRFRNQAVHGARFDADKTLAALVAVSELLRLIRAESGREQIRELIGSIDDGRGARRGPLDAVDIKVECAPVIGYAHAVAGLEAEVSVALSLPDSAAGAPGPVEATVTIIEDDGGHELVEPWRFTCDAGAQRELHTSRALKLNRDNLAQVDQPGPAHVRVELRTRDGAKLVRRIDALSALPPRQWQQTGGDCWAGPALATFVQPDQPAVQALAAQARLRAGLGTAAFAPDDVADAACALLRSRGIAADGGGFRGRDPLTVRTAGEVMDARSGSALDVAVLLAGILEQLGGHPVLALTPASVLLGYARNDAASTDGSPEAFAAGVRQGGIGLIDPVAALCSPAGVLHAPGDAAQQIVEATLAELTLVVPLAAARSGGAVPQPVLERDEDDVVVELPLPPSAARAEQDAAGLSAPTPAPADQTRPAPEPGTGRAADAAPARVEEWKRSLLDLSLRNPLIDRTARSAIELKVPPELVGDFEDIVNKRDNLGLRAAAGFGGRPARGAAQAADDATELLKAHTVGAVLGSKEYVRRLQNLAASARTTLEETGANNLYLAIGTLCWYADGQRVRSPLILIPVKLEREGDTFIVSLDEAGVSTPNYSLLARFQADTGIELTALREPEYDDHGVNVEATLDKLRQQLRAAGRRDRVEPTVHLGLFRFSTYRMWRDLAEDWPTIIANPLVARLLDGTPGAGAADQAAGPATDLDEVVENLPLVADSAQAQVIADAVSGRNLVVEGPPGTGKSQTVANLIFRSLALGRTVMFVAEKQSALDVVARRLGEETGIGDLLLNLHDNGMRPTRVREALRRALELQAPGHDAAAMAGLRRQLTDSRGELEAYREHLHAPGQEGKSYYAARQALVEAMGTSAAPHVQAVFNACATRSGLDGFDAGKHEAQLDEYRRLQASLREQLAPELLDEVLRRRDRVLRESGDRAEKLRRELERRKGTLNVRELVNSYWDLITAITPCILVSPDSVARFFPPNRRYVDMVVFDEASQITVADAVGALGRGHTAVVVGDPKQMPPTPSPGTAAATGRSASGDGGADSILDRCLELGLPTRRLTWHYRSRVESLIAFSNRHYYDGRLLSFPSPLVMAAAPDDGPDGYGISLRRVNGTYYRAETAKHRGIRPNTNPVEARQIVDEVSRRFEASPQATPSLGIITFNNHQCELIEAELRNSGRKRIIDALKAPDGLFVRNLNNVQGEERDTILVSVTFSANERGDLPLNFGSLSQAGGQRRLNVAITRARRQVVVFSSFDPEDLHAERSTHQGVKDLREYLGRARSGIAPHGRPRSVASVDLHRDQIAERLREAGAEVMSGVGHSDFEIDLVVTGAGGRRVAVLLDGPGWNRRASATDRDLLPVDVLHSMGWERIERVWMPTWVADADAVAARLLAASGGAPDAASAMSSVSAASAPTPPSRPQPTAAETEAAPTPTEVLASEPLPEQTQPAAPDAAAASEATPLTTTEYRQWRPVGVYPLEVLNRAQDVDSPERAQVVETARAICDVESPLTRHRLIVKLCRAYGLTRVVSSREEKVDALLGDAFAYTDAAGFVWRSMDAARMPVHYRRHALDHVDSIEEIHPRELVALMREVRAGSAGWVSTEDLCNQALKRLSVKKRRLSASGVKKALTDALAEVEREDDGW
ncbi:AAA domain-containing protein [Actinomyces ruminicola]|uniref:AAA domain-containing protein n=1 Tax=Actinomyces ruminicola TaxID=332524 RepID=A0A1H0DEF9_9ACTO|nr:DUF4011 domain-containing protein [Actinomyces ruminicola]SDN68351.1 AAA domain-containing protein [Actinomyces ruminicola]